MSGRMLTPLFGLRQEPPRYQATVASLHLTTGPQPNLLPNVMGSGVTHELCQCQALRLAGMLNSYGHKKDLPASAESLFISRMGPSGNSP